MLLEFNQLILNSSDKMSWFERENDFKTANLDWYKINFKNEFNGFSSCTPNTDYIQMDIGTTNM